MAGPRVATVAAASFHPSAECLDPACEWERPAAWDTQARAKAHVKESGHTVALDQVNRRVYGVAR